MSERFGRYTLLKRLGAGGMGEVFLAQQVGSEGTDHYVVVKTLLPQLTEDEDLVRMFLEEAKLASQLDHPNICRMLDLGLEDGILFMALEYIRGVDLEKLQKRATAGGARIPVPIAVRIVADAARGLDHAHHLTDDDGVLLGLVHRDVSPHNLLVTFDGKVKVIDFGLAKTVGRAQQSHTGSLKGKFAYMSPEMVRAERIDLRVDVFALGIILHELLSGERLFRQDSDVATLAAIAQCEVPRPGELNRAVTPELDEVVFKALAKDRPKRYQSAAAFADALESLLEQFGGRRNADLGGWMRGLYRDQLAEENAKGLLHDAPAGAVMKMRSLSASGVAIEVVARQEATSQPSEPSSIVIDNEPTNPNSRPTSPDAPTEEAVLDEDGIPVKKGGVRLAPRPVAPPVKLAGVARPARVSVASLPPPIPLAGDPEIDEDEETIPLGASSPFDVLRREALRLTGTDDTPPPAPVRAPVPPARQPPPPRRPVAAPPATVHLAPAYFAEPELPPNESKSTWIGLGIGLAVAVVVFAAALIALS